MTDQQLLLVSPEGSLSQKQSLYLVQIFLNASLACIAHTRELIPWTSPCLRTRYIDQIDPAILVTEGNLYTKYQSLDPGGVQSGQEIRILVRGGHKRADQILEMLENGVFEALQHGYLETLQVFVTDNNGNPPAILETYSFAFSYDGGRVSSIELSPTDHVFILEHFHKSFKASIRALLRSLKQLPRLPARRKLGMSLTYTEECPDVYQPPGFMDRNNLKEPNGQGLCAALGQGVEDIVGTLDTGHHQVNVRVCRKGSDEVVACVDPQDAIMSKQLQAMQKTSSIRSNDLVSTLRDPRPRKRHDEASVHGGKRLKLALTENPLAENLDEERRKLRGRNDDLGASTGQADRVSSENVSASSQDGSVHKKNRRLIPSKLAELLVNCYAIQCGTSGENGNVFDQSLLADGTIQRRIRSHRIRCECGSTLPSSPMIYCEVCDNWQHGKCYGYDRTSLSHQPTDRFCYTCLFFPADDDPVHSPAYIIAMRLAVGALSSIADPSYVVDEENLRTILRPMHCTEQLLNAAVGKLVAEGLLAPRDRQHWHVRSLSEPKLKELRHKYGNPFALIDHLYDSVSATRNRDQHASRITSALEKYARGQDYRRAKGCVEVISYDQTGDPVSRWGYFEDKPASITGSSTSINPPATPARRRKVSISQMLVNIDRSPSAGSMSFEESSLQLLEDITCSSDASPVSSTATAD